MALCAIALGSNLGDSQAILKQALEDLEASPGIHVVIQSPFYQTAPVGPPQPDYFNACAILRTTLTPEQVLQTLLKVEAQHGRIRRERWGPRRLDLDLLLFEDLVLSTNSLDIPHPRMRERAFVLVPLVAIAPDWVDPVSGKTVQALAALVDPTGVLPTLC